MAALLVVLAALVSRRRDESVTAGDPEAVVEGRWHDVLATVFADRLIAHRGPRGDYTMLPSDILASLPDRSALGRRIDVYCISTGAILEVDVLDIGPWHIDDPYWDSPEGLPRVVVRPEAPTYSTKKPATSEAAVDLSPEAWVRLGKPREQAYKRTPTGAYCGVRERVQWRWAK